MSRKNDESYFEEDAKKDVRSKCPRPPQQIPWSNPNEVRASQKDEASVAMEEGVSLEEKDKIKGAHPQKMAAEGGIDIEHPDTSGDQRMVSFSRDLNVSLGAASLVTEVHQPTEGRRRRSRIPEVRPGAFRQGGSDNEEGYYEDEHTIESYAEPPIPHTLSAELVNTTEEQRRIQDMVNQALERERQNAVVAEIVTEIVPVVEEDISNKSRSRRMKLAGAFLLLLVILIVVGVVLGIKLPQPSQPNQPTLSPEALRSLLSSVSSDQGKALQNSSTPQNMAFNWLADDNPDLGNYTNETIIQRYALATLYFSTNGYSWENNASWLDNGEECGRWQTSDGEVTCSDTGVVAHLDLSENNLHGRIPPEIGLLTSLEYLFLQSNSLAGMIPTEIGQLTQLKDLELWGNTLQGTMPSEVGQLTALSAIAVAYNKLTGTMPSQISSLTNLGWLNFYDNVFTGSFTCPDLIDNCFISCDHDDNNYTDACRSL